MKIREASMREVTITGGFWKNRQDINRNVTVGNVKSRFEETGRFAAFDFNWKEGDPKKPHIFWDSDIAKWLESAAYLIEKQPEPELEKTVDGIVDLIEKNRMDDGYFNSYFQVCEPEERFTIRYAHELYCAGHLIEAAVAYYEATGKKKFLNLMCDYADLIEKIFKNEKSAEFDSPGHEEIELALVKLYRATGERRYLELSRYFVDVRGTEDDSYTQAHMPVVQQREAVGHAVRAVYLYCAVADLALEYGDAELLETARALFRDIVNKKMYITGGIGATCAGEAFLEEYNLPNTSSYAETCAAIGLALFAHRMGLVDPDSAYADVFERVLYNGFLCGVSLDGKSFFYSNANEVNLELNKSPRDSRHAPFISQTNRVEVFDCSCCPPNVTRFIAELNKFCCKTDGETVWLDQYMSMDADFDGCGITVETDYPKSGKISVSTRCKGVTLAMRIPNWCKNYNLTQNGKSVQTKCEKGYVKVKAAAGDNIILELAMDVMFMENHPAIRENCGRMAVQRGPVLFCMEGIDNGALLRDIRLPVDPSAYSVETDFRMNVDVLTCTARRHTVCQGLPLYSCDGYNLESFKAKLIPYYAFANREESDMLIWCLADR